MNDGFVFGKPLVIVVAFLVIGTLAGGYLLFQPEELPYEFGYAERRDISAIIFVTGRVVPAEEVDLAFESAGRVEHIAVDVGEKVYRGSLLVALDSRELSSQLLEQQAAIRIKEAELAELLRGSREEEIRVSEVTVENKRVALDDARRDLTNKIRDAFTKTDDAIRNNVDQFYTNPRTSPQLNQLTIADSALRRKLESERLVIESLLKNWNNSLVFLMPDETVLGSAVEVKAWLSESTIFLDSVAYMVNGLQASSNLTQATLDGYKADVATARSNINTATVNITAAEEKTRTAASALLLAEKELALTKAGASPENSAAAQAALEQAQAKAATIEAQLAKKLLRSPIAGIVTAVDIGVGEIVSAGMVVVSLISTAEFTIETNVPEVDIAGVAIGKEAEVTLDAYGRNEVFMAVVTRIDPAETIVEGIATYKVTLQFLKQDNRIKSGMTANIDILHDARRDVVAIPRRALYISDNLTYVRIRRQGVVEEIPVTTGLQGTDGYVEIVSGITEGEEVVVFVKEQILSQ